MTAASTEVSGAGTLPDAATQIEIYRRMSRIKQNDEATRRVIKSGKIQVPYYSPRGQEVIPSAISVNLDDRDTICTIYRGSHDMIAKGVPLRNLWAEIAGRVTGSCKGKGGPMHVTDVASGVMLTTGIVGSSMPIANGLAWAAQLRGDNAVTVSYFGDGASNIGAFHETLNLASLWKLPVIFVCQNNRFAEHTRFEHCTAIDSIAKRSASYSMPGVQIDGNDPFAVYSAAKAAIERARRGEGPTLIEAETFRFFGHVFGDDDAYMAPGEKDRAAGKDPVPAFRARLLASATSDEVALDAIDSAIAVEIEDAISFALGSAPPPAEELHRDVFAVECLQ